jgi:hypothetical protein
MAKRYEFRETGTQPKYDEHYNRIRLQSTILKGANTFTCNISDLQGCKAALAQLIGNSITQPGYYLLENSLKIAQLPALQMDEKIIQLEWQNYQQRIVNSGRRPIEDKLDNMPEHLKDKLLKCFAYQDVVNEEIAYLSKKILELSEDTIKAKTDFLKFGPLGTSKANASGIICMLDGQKVSLVNGIPTITEPTSIYLNMCCSDYFDYIVSAFRAQRKAIEQDYLIREQSKAREEGQPIPKTSSYSSVGRPISRESLPPWPDNVKPNIQKVVEVVEELPKSDKAQKKSVVKIY